MTNMTNPAIGQLKAALHRILDAIRVNEVELAKSAAPTKIQVFFLDGTLREKKIAEDERKAWKRDPVGLSLRLGLRQIGKLIVQNGSVSDLETMSEIINEHENGDWRAVMLDKNWDGLKDSEGRTWCS